MPQSPYDWSELESGYDWSELENPQKEQGWLDWSIEQGLRTAPAVIGGLGAGLLATPETFGMGTIPAAMAGGGAGAALGQYLGDWYSGKESTPLEYAITTGAGAIPGFLGPSAAKTVGGRLLGNAARGALEGAVTNVATTPFEEYAQTGHWTPTAERVMRSGIGGAVFGAPIGAAAGHFFGHNAPDAPPVDAPPPPVEAAPPRPLITDTERWNKTVNHRIEPYQDMTTMGGMPIGMPEPIYGPEVGPYGTPRATGMPQPDLGFDDPVQNVLDFGAYRGARGRYTNEGPGLPPTYGPEVGIVPPPTPPNQPPLDFNEPSQTNLFPPDQPPPGGGGPPVSNAPAPIVTPQNRDVVTVQNPDAASIQMLRDQGYVSVPGLRSPEGYVQMVRGDIAPMYVTGDKRLPKVETPQPVVRPEVPSAIGPGQMAATDTVSVPKAKVNETYIKNMAAGGYRIASQDANNVYFRQMTENELAAIADQPQFSRRPSPDEPVEFVPDDYSQPKQPGDVNTGMPAPELPTAPTLRPGSWRGMNPRDAVGRIGAENNVDIAERNFRELDQALAYTKRAGDPAATDQAQYLRDIALDHYRMLKNELGVGEITGPTPPRRSDISQLRQQSLLGPTTPDEDINFARNPLTGRAEIGVNVAHSARELTSGYNRPLPFVMAREGLQNAFDAIKHMATGAQTKIKFIPGDDKKGTLPSIEIRDNGKGMSPDELYTVYTNLHESGKANDANATGGKGVGKATYMLGGGHFDVVTIKQMPDGTKVKSGFSGTPEELMSGFDVRTEVVPPNTPTGTTFRTILKDGQSIYDATHAVDKITKFSRNLPGELEVQNTWGGSQKHNFNRTKDTVIANDVPIDGANNTADIIIPEGTNYRTSKSLQVEVLNNGMWQFSEYMGLGDEHHGIPDRVIVDLKPKVAELSDEYPFPVQRESVKDHVWKEIEMAVQSYVAQPMSNRKKYDLAQLWKDMSANTSNTGTNRESIFFDPGERLTPEELKFVTNSSTIKEAQNLIDAFINDALIRLGRQDVIDKLVRTGIYMSTDRYTYGVHVPNPTAPKAESGIMLNLFAHILDNPDNPREASRLIVDTLQHEMAHIGRDTPERIPFDFANEDMNDPRVGEYFAKFLNHMNEQGGLDMGHGMEFIRRMGEILAKTGARNAIAAADEFESILTRGSGKYSPEVQELLQLYTDSRGRPESREDILTPTGIKQTTPGNRPQNVRGTNRPDGDGTATWRERTGIGMGMAVRKKEGELNFIKEALQLPSSLTTTMDLSAPGRQGLSMILTPQFWKAAGAMFKGLSAEGFNAIDADLKAKPLFRKRIDMETGTVGKSVAEEIGMRLFTPASRPGPRAEGIASRWLETGGNIPYVSAAYRNTIGAPIRMSNRAYITFLNHLNANRTEFLMNQARNMSIEALDKGAVRTGMAPWKTKFSPQEAMNLNPYHNLALGKEIADFVNTATGHGPLKTHLLPHKSAEVSLESAASKLGYVLFSPGLLASRVRMLNPNTYIMATPYVRKQYAKAALGTFAAWGAFTQLAKMGGAEVGEDPTSADFGKVRIGDTRIDPGAGFLQYWVLANRALQGGYTSSSTGEFHRFGEGFQAETQLSNALRFGSNKLNPAAKFAWDVMNASEYQPFHVKDRLAQLAVPLFLQDMYELSKEDPNLAPWLVPMMFGVGAQTYSKGESVGKLVDPENDWLATGGGIADLGPDYIHPRLDY